jgi:hypothetical protein
MLQLLQGVVELLLLHTQVVGAPSLGVRTRCGVDGPRVVVVAWRGGLALERDG